MALVVAAVFHGSFGIHGRNLLGGTDSQGVFETDGACGQFATKA